MAVQKSKETRVGWMDATNTMEHLCQLHCFGYQKEMMGQHQNGVAGMLHCISNLQPTLISLLFGTAISTFPNNLQAEQAGYRRTTGCSYNGYRSVTASSKAMQLLVVDKFEKSDRAAAIPTPEHSALQQKECES